MHFLNDFTSLFSDIIDKGDTLYILRNIQQELCAPAQQRVSYLPHYDTIVKGGMYEYYASEGQNPLRKFEFSLLMQKKNLHMKSMK